MDPDLFDGLRDSLAAQFGAAVETLRGVIEACPDDLWHDPPGFGSFFHTAYHTVFFLDFYLSSIPESEYHPPEPFTRSEFEEPFVLPPRVYSRAEVLAFLDRACTRFDATVRRLTPARAVERFRSGWMDFTIFELHLYNMRHVQHHAAQLNRILRERGAVPVDWVSGRH